MYFYHGTTEIIKDIDFEKCRLRTDFGRGFYLSSKLATARIWAIGKAGFSGVPTIMRYDVDKDIWSDKTLHTLRFDSTTEQWLNFVRDNRQSKPHNNIEPRHTYDVVSGPIADDKVVDVVDLYCMNKISAVEAIKRAKALPSVFQMSLHTDSALKYIVGIMISERKNNKWSEWRYI